LKDAIKSWGVFYTLCIVNIWAWSHALRAIVGAISR
jgi:hypothetical protein